MRSHRLRVEGEDINRQTFRCSCGRWQAAMPRVGYLRSTETEARQALALAGFDEHRRAARARARGIIL